MEGNVRTREFSFLIEATLCDDGNAPTREGRFTIQAIQE